MRLALVCCHPDSPAPFASPASFEASFVSHATGVPGDSSEPVTPWSSASDAVATARAHASADVFDTASLSEWLGFPAHISQGASAAVIAFLYPYQAAAEQSVNHRGALHFVLLCF